MSISPLAGHDASRNRHSPLAGCGDTNVRALTRHFGDPGPGGFPWLFCRYKPVVPGGCVISRDSCHHLAVTAASPRSQGFRSTAGRWTPPSAVAPVNHPPLAGRTSTTSFGNLPAIGIQQIAGGRRAARQPSVCRSFFAQWRRLQDRLMRLYGKRLAAM